MNISEVDELKGKYCRVISKVPEDSGLEGVFYDFGVIKDFDSQNGLVSVQTKNGLRLLQISELFDVMCMESLVSKKF
jgi:hypothetical protein